MADIGNLYFDILLRDMTDADIDKIKKKLEKVGVKIGADVDRKTFEANIKAALKNKTFDVNLSAGKNIKKAAIEANKSVLTKSVTDALKGKTFSADLKLVVRNATVQDAIRQAFAQAGMQYNTTASDVRAQRIAEIQQRMAIRAANAQRNLGNSYRYSANGAHESARASVVLGRSLHANIRLAGELGTALGNFASVFGIKDLLQDIVRIGGQLENQRIALGAILQDGGKATEMFSKIQSLAVKSPFGIMDLNQYTKQLSAYSIPYNELYETMKRLADISAGVGVDMGRIVLAFGQVRAAGFLKGTELRQFTEANIPMVDKLAERFSNLEKRIVSAGEVYDMISKKKVTFEDVKAVLWDLTGEGGMFNNMQEVLSESLASKWKNLADAIDVMYGRIADGGIGSGLKSLAETLTELTKNWEYVATAMGTATGAYLVYKAAVLLGSRQIAGAKSTYEGFIIDKRKEANNLRIASTYRELTRAEQMLIDTSGRLTALDARRLIQTGLMNKELALQLIATKKLDAATTSYLASVYNLDAQMVRTAQRSTWFKRAIISAGNALRSFGLAMKSFLFNPTTWVFAGITAITELATYYSKKQDEIDERNKNFAESAKGSAETLERELVKIKDLDITKLNTDEMRVKVKEFTTTIQNEADGWQSILSEIFAKEADGTFKNSVEEQLKLLKTKMEELAEAKKKLMGDDEMYSDAIGATETGIIFKDDVIDKIKEYNKAVDDNDKKLKQLGIHARDVSDALNYAIGGNKVISEELSGKSLNEQVALLSEYIDEWQKFIEKLSETNPQARSIASIWKANIPSSKEIEDAFSSAKTAMDNSFALKGEDINNFTERGRQAIYGFVDGMITESATQRPKMKQWMYDWWTDIYNIPRNDLDYVVPSQITTIGSGGAGGSKKDAVAEMWKKRAAEIEKAVKMYDQWKKVEGKLLAENRVKYNEELSNLFNGAYGFNLDLENPTEAYEYIQSLLDESKEKQKELKVNLGVKISDAELKDAQEEVKKFLDEMKEYIKKTDSQWDLYKEVFDATGNRSLALNLAFDGEIPGFDNYIEHLKGKMTEEIKKRGLNISADELLAMGKEGVASKVNDKTATAWTEDVAKNLNLIIDQYNSANNKLRKESIDNFLEIIKSSKDFAQQIEDEANNLQRALNTIYSMPIPIEEKRRMEVQAYENYDEKVAEINFEKFKKTSGWVKIFDDLSRVSTGTLDGLLDDIEEFLPQGVESEEVFKALIKAIRDIKEELLERNPFRAFGADVSKELGEINNKIKEYNRQIKEAKKNGNIDLVNNLEDKKHEEESRRKEIYTNYSEAFKHGMNKVSEFASAVGEVSSILEKFGNRSLKSFGQLLDSLTSGMQSGFNVGSMFEGAGGVVGGFLGAAVGAMSGIVEAGRKAVEAEQERSQIVIDRLEKVASLLKDKIADSLTGLYNSTLDATSRMEMTLQKEKYDAAEKYYKDKGVDVSKGWYATTFDKTTFSWDTNDYLMYSKKTHDAINQALESDNEYMAAYASMLAQRDEMMYQMASYRDKDSDKVDAYKRDKQIEIEKLTMEIEQLSKDMMSSLYSVDFQEWSSQLANSIVNAWATGEDAAKAYEGTVSDIMRNVATSLVKQQIIGDYLNKNLKPFIDDFIAKNGVMDKEMFSNLGNIVEGVGDRTEDAVKFMDSLEQVMNEKGLTLKDVSSDSSSGGGLSKGIESVTEDTANLLASYLNSIRQSISVKQGLLEKLVSDDLPQMSYLAQAQLRELSQIQTNTAKNVALVGEIRDLVNRVVDKGNNRLKV